MIAIRQLCRSFSEGAGIHRVLDGAEACFPAGETAAIVGRSGCGKSTLLNLICGIDRADSGEVRIGGRIVTSMGEPERTLFRRAHIGFVYQFFNLLPTLNVEQNVRLALELNGMRGAAARQRSAAMLAAVGLGDRLHSAVDRLSGGEQQRVAIARALAHEPAVVLADEPTGNLDEQSASQVLRLLLSLTSSRGTTLIIVTHDPGVAARADRVLELREGKLVAADASVGSIAADGAPDAAEAGRTPVRRTGIS